jgi:3-oxosteroid 1-dehydrogenase
MKNDTDAKKALSRRSFIKTTAVGVGATALTGVGTKEAEAQGPNMNWDLEADIVVVGTGMAGMSAAVTAHDAGANVLVLEKMPQWLEGGNSKVCMQFIWAPKDLEKGIQYIKAMDCGMVEDESMYRLMAEGLVENLQVLKDLGAELAPFTFAVGFPELPGADSYQTWATSVNGSTVGISGNMRLWKFMRDQVEKRGIRIMYETPATELVQHPRTKEVIGVKAKNGGWDRYIKARYGVVLACGGLEFDYAMQKQYFQGAPVMGIGTPGNTADGIKMAVAAGADLWHMNEPNGGDPGCFIVPGMDVNVVGVASASPKGTTIRVNQIGKRYYYENVRSRSHGTGTRALDFDAYAFDWPIPCWYIFDDTARKSARMLSTTASGTGAGAWTWFAIHSGYTWSADNSEEVAKGWILKADTIAELAEKIKADPDNNGKMVPANLETTLTNYNQYCADGVDPEWKRAASSLKPIGGPPYYAMKIWPNTANTMGGPRRNKNMEIVNPFKKPIGRLYGTGELGSLWGWTYSSGGNMGECLFSGRISVKHALSLEPWS